MHTEASVVVKRVKFNMVPTLRPHLLINPPIAVTAPAPVNPPIAVTVPPPLLINPPIIA